MNLLQTARKCMVCVYRYITGIRNEGQGRMQRQQLISSFPEPEDLLERSWFQYCCQLKSLIWPVRLMQNLCALFALPFCLLIYRKAPDSSGKKAQAVYLSDGIDQQIIPESLKQAYAQIHTCSYNERPFLGKGECSFLRTLFRRYWYSPFFCLKSAVKVGLYAALIRQYAPAALIVYNEYSFTSSLLTQYCREQKILHLNIMHGEKLYNCRDAFAEYDRYYVWDSYYRALLESMRAPARQLITELPQALCPATVPGREIYDITYYLGGESSRCLRRLQRLLKALQADGFSVCVRYHPRFSNVRRVRRIFAGFPIEDPAQTPILQSLQQTRRACAVCSTVLFQAYCLGREILIDDLTRPKRYAQLQDLGYILLHKPHGLLSALLYPAEDRKAAVQPAERI